MRGSLRLHVLLLATVAAALVAVAPAQAKVGQARTTGPQYDRNPSVVQDGGLTYMFFARSVLPCNRLGAPPCNPDVSKYDLYYKVSPDGGKTYGPPQLAAANIETANPIFYGRTIAATRTTGGTIYVFWASGGNSTVLYYIEKAPSATAFSDPAPVLGIPSVDGTFNVEAVSLGPDVYLYTEECCAPTATGIYAYQFVGGTAVGRTLVALGMNLPKAIVDNQPGPIRFRMTMTEASQYPTVDVYVSSSADGLNWTPPQLAVHEDGVSNWDPNLAQMPNGRYYLHFAPDAELGAGRQQIGVTTSNDFARWTTPHEVSPGFTGGTEYWDYWPEGFVLGNKLTLYYTSERGFDANPNGIGHIWTVPGSGGLDENQVANSSFESSSTGVAPDGWAANGATMYANGGTDGARSVTAGPLGSWTSAPVAVEPGSTYVVAADAGGFGGTVAVEQLSATGQVLGGLTQTLGVLPVGFAQTIDETVTIADGASSVRLRLEGGLAGQTSFDDVQLWRQ
jgi:hypothetical protein